MKKIKANILKGIIFSNEPEAFSLHEKSRFGEKVREKIQYSFFESLYLLEKNKMEIYSNNKKISERNLINKIKKADKRILIKYTAYRDLKEKGYIIKTALKFGADFRIYEKGSRPGNKHAKWLLFVDSESNKLAWHEFTAKVRIAHSTRKNLLLAIVDEEGDLLYYEIKWKKL